MRQPEARFKAKLIELPRDAAAGLDPWYTYLSPGGPGQKQGVPDLIFGDSSHGLVWVEAKVGDGTPKLKKLQPRTVLGLVRVGAKVVIANRRVDNPDTVGLWMMSGDGVLYLVDSAALSPALWPAIWRLP